VVLRSALLPVLVITLALAACSDDGSGEVQGPPAQGPSIYGPLQDTRQAGHDYVTAQTAINRQLDAAWVTCMKGRGYDFPPPSLTPQQVLTDGFHVAYGTDIANPAVRSTEGYGVTSKLVGLRSVYQRSNKLITYVEGLDATARNSFDAVLDACSDQAHSQVLPTAELTEFDDATQEIAVQIQSDQRVRAGQAAWAACMKAAGLPYPQADTVRDNLEARAKPLYQAAKPGVVAPAAQALHAEELRTAAQDWACRKTTINPAFVTVRNELESKFIDEHPELADRVWQRMSEVIAKGSQG
jgi:hypothetical protein